MPKDKTSQNKQYELPQATVNRLIKEVCSTKINVGKNAKSAISKSAAVFILYLAWNANEICTSNGRSTIQAQDVLNALEECEFAEFIPELEQHLANYRAEHQQIKQTEKTKATERRNVQRQKRLQELKEKKQLESELQQNQLPNGNIDINDNNDIMMSNNNNNSNDNGVGNNNNNNDITVQSSLNMNINNNSNQGIPNPNANNINLLQMMNGGNISNTMNVVNAVNVVNAAAAGQLSMANGGIVGSGAPPAMSMTAALPNFTFSNNNNNNGGNALISQTQITPMLNNQNNMVINNNNNNNNNNNGNATSAMQNLISGMQGFNNFQPPPNQ